MSSTDPQVSSKKKSKKRRHDGSDQERSSSKKRKKSRDVEESRSNETTDKPHEDVTITSKGNGEKRRKKKKEKKHSEQPDPLPTSKILTNGEHGANERVTDTTLLAVTVESEGDIKKQKKKKKKTTKSKGDPTSLDSEIGEDVIPNGSNKKRDVESPVDTVDGMDVDDAQQDDPLTLPVEEQEADYAYGFNFLESADQSCFYSTRISLCLPIPAISLAKASPSILSAHLAPLILTYFEAAHGIILAFSEPVLSAKTATGSTNHVLQRPRDGDNQLQAGDEVRSLTHDEFGVCWVWMTVTFLVFRPEPGDELHGWTNVTSEGFVGLVSYNFFQSSIGKNRIPTSWSWSGPTRDKRRRGRRGRLSDGVRNSPSLMRDGMDSQQTMTNAADNDDIVGQFVDAEGEKVAETLRVRVVDTEMVPTHERDKWSLQINGSLLDDEAEIQVLEEEQAKFERVQNRGRSKTPAVDVQMSGGVALSLDGNVDSGLSQPTPLAKHRVQY